MESLWIFPFHCLTAIEIGSASRTLETDTGFAGARLSEISRLPLLTSLEQALSGSDIARPASKRGDLFAQSLAALRTA
jgi:hypothetical protein